MTDQTKGEGTPIYFVEKDGTWVHHDTVLGEHVLAHPDDATPFGLAEASAIADAIGGVVYHRGSPLPGARACSVCGRAIYLPQLAEETPEHCRRCAGSEAQTDEPGVRVAGVACVLANGGQAGRYFQMSASDGGTPVYFCREEGLALAEYLRLAVAGDRPLKLAALHATAVDTGVLLQGDATLEATCMGPVVLPRAACEGVAAFLVTTAPRANSLADYIGPEEAALVMAAWQWRSPDESET